MSTIFRAQLELALERRKQTSMIYSKPRVDVLGEAVCIIQGKKVGPSLDGPPPYGTQDPPPPTAELDE
jgi:hypothetical protein